MIDRFAWLNCRLIVALFLFVSALGVTGHAAAEDAHVTYFNEGVLGANEAKPEPQPVLLAPAELKIIFESRSGVTVTPTETAAIDKLAPTLAGIVRMEAMIFKTLKGPFALEAIENQQPFTPEEMSASELVVLFADGERHGQKVRAILDAAYNPQRQQYPGLWTETRAMFGCGLFLFRTQQQAVSAILVIPPEEELGTASYCVNFAILETAGFRGRVTSVAEGICKSPRCAGRARTTISAWDYLALSALYGVDDPKPITALYRFKELFKAAPKSVQSPD